MKLLLSAMLAGGSKMAVLWFTPRHMPEPWGTKWADDAMGVWDRGDRGLALPGAHVSPSLCPTAPRRWGKPTIDSAFHSCSPGCKIQRCACCWEALIWPCCATVAEGGNCSLAKGHPVSCDPGPPFWEQLSVGEFLPCPSRSGSV